MSAPSSRFRANFSAPGFSETEVFPAGDADEAQRRAEAYARQPWGDWPYEAFRSGRGTVTVEEVKP